MSTKLLALDTSSDACTVALGIGDEVWVRHTEIPRKHGECILSMVDELLASSGVSLQSLDALAYGCGPGSFTGLRIAAGVVQGLAFGADLPVVSVSSLAVLAHRAWREKGWSRCHVAFDARMGEVYWGSYCWDDASKDMRLLGVEQLAPPNQLRELPAMGAEPWYGVGSGWCYQSEFAPQLGAIVEIDEGLLPHGLDVLALGKRHWQQGKASNALTVAPVYLRDNVAAKPKIFSSIGK